MQQWERALKEREKKGGGPGDQEGVRAGGTKAGCALYTKAPEQLPTEKQQRLSISKLCSWKGPMVEASINYR